jgi:hypothetical protein
MAETCPAQVAISRRGFELTAFFGLKFLSVIDDFGYEWIKEGAAFNGPARELTGWMPDSNGSMPGCNGCGYCN